MALPGYNELIDQYTKNVIINNPIVVKDNSAV